MVKRKAPEMAALKKTSYNISGRLIMVKGDWSMADDFSHPPLYQNSFDVVKLLRGSESHSGYILFSFSP
jgi:hypothetical protein